ncbi:hypothetical protein QQ008_27275 [Fulvivirgaceae bacterium BMA10]|uniref:Uncharacterized protein n=1 Tax=Splendidivirga corallicola TaxID=3051826 RepID=A0ABT8KWG7_9BACT|nr:hypothetical protein [Fulvivirgaceae bacterium BMA10]
MAPIFGRVPLPAFRNSNVQPLTLWTCILNRHYVKPELFEVVKDTAKKMSEKDAEVIIAYLDANFPFKDGFPLFPHLSHSDGEKLDLAFFYKSEINKKVVYGKASSWIGYGVFEGPQPGEYDAPRNCIAKGYWQYDMAKYLVWNPRRLELDEDKTKEMIRYFTANKSINKVFLEPHLKSRLNLKSEKIRFHGCRAVRHDDHVHIQL